MYKSITNIIIFPIKYLLPYEQYMQRDPYAESYSASSFVNRM